MKSLRNSPSTDCFSSDETILKNDNNVSSEKIILKKNNLDSKPKRASSKSFHYGTMFSSPNKIIKELINTSNINIYRKENSTNKKLIDVKRCNSVLNLKKIKSYETNRKPLNIFKEKSSGRLSHYYNRSIYNEEISSNENMSNNHFIDKQNIRNELENNITVLIEEIKKNKVLIDHLKDSISQNKNENTKISLIHQRFLLQSNYIENENKKLKEELIKVSITII